MVLWHVNSLHLAKICIGTQKMSHYNMRSPHFQKIEIHLQVLYYLQTNITMSNECFC